MYKVTINGQLFLLMLIERLEDAGIHVISANTDGIVTIVPKGLEETADNICHWWEKHLGLELEFTSYSKYITEGVNSYLTVKTDGKKKFKGRMNPKMYLEDLSKGYNSPIVAKAVTEYFINGTPVMETLRNSKSILDFVVLKTLIVSIILNILMLLIIKWLSKRFKEILDSTFLLRGGRS